MKTTFRSKKSILILSILILMLIPTNAFADSFSLDGYTLFFPDDYGSCQPMDLITTEGVPADKTLNYTLSIFVGDVQTKLEEGSVTGNLSVYFPYPPVDDWTLIDPATGARRGDFAAFVALTDPANGKSIILRGKWSVTCEPPKESPGTGTPGYWMNHPEAWPVDVITIGGITYSKETAINFMKDPVKKDKTFTMFPALVAAKLNVLIGNEAGCVAGTIDAADAWMAEHPVGSHVKGSSDAWKEGEPLYWTLDAYNNGLLCAPSRDLFD